MDTSVSDNNAIDATVYPIIDLSCNSHFKTSRFDFATTATAKFR